MPDLIIVADPYPGMPVTNPPGINLNISCASHLSLKSFTAIPFLFTISGPTDLNGYLVSCVVEASTQYNDLCNCLRSGGQVQITLQHDVLYNGLIVVRKVTCQALATSQPVSTQLMEIHESTERIERDLTVSVRNDLNLLKAQMVQVLARLPPLASPSGQHVSGFPVAEDISENSEGVLFGSEKAS